MTEVLMDLLADEYEAPERTVCSACHRTFHIPRIDGVQSFSMPDLFGLTEYACSLPCYQDWVLSKG